MDVPRQPESNRPLPPDIAQRGEQRLLALRQVPRTVEDSTPHTGHAAARASQHVHDPPENGVTHYLPNPNSTQPEQDRPTVLTHSWPLRCRLESTASIEGPRVSSPHPQPCKIASFPLKFEEPG